MGVLNSKAAGQAPYARTGKDGALYSSGGKLLATVENFTAQAAFNNAQYKVLGTALEMETVSTHKITLTMSQVVVEDDVYIKELFDFLNNGKAINWNFQGVVKGRNGKSEERVVYKNCIPSGQIDLQNITPDDIYKRNWSFTCNAEPKLQKKLVMK